MNDKSETTLLQRQYEPSVCRSHPDDDVRSGAARGSRSKGADNAIRAAAVDDDSELIASMPRVLTWQPSPDVMDALAARDVTVARARTIRTLEHVAGWNLRLAQSMRECLNELPPWSAIRFMLAPETINRSAILARDPHTHISFLADALRAEGLLSGTYTSSNAYWTALGDFYISRRNDTDAAGENGTPESAHSSDWRAPRVDRTIPIDVRSPHVQRAGTRQSPLEQYAPEEYSKVHTRIEAGFMRVADVSPAAARAIARFVKVIVSAKTSSGAPGSSSTYDYPGRVLLRNAHRANEATIASSLVHETIHQMLYVIEYGGQFVDNARLAAERVQSPWTGSNLPIHSYLHACFVWYGLAQFWRLAADARAFSSELAASELRKSLAGFRESNPVDRLAPHVASVRPEALEAAATLYERA